MYFVSQRCASPSTVQKKLIVENSPNHHGLSMGPTIKWHIYQWMAGLLMSVWDRSDLIYVYGLAEVFNSSVRAIESLSLSRLFIGAERRRVCSGMPHYSRNEERCHGHHQGFSGTQERAMTSGTDVAHGEAHQGTTTLHQSMNILDSLLLYLSVKTHSCWARTQPDWS